MSADAKIAELNLELPKPQKPVGTYIPVVRVGNLIYVSGHGPTTVEGTQIKGVVGADLSEEEGKAAARAVGLAMLSTIRNYLGSLDRVKRLIKVLGMVNSAPDFEHHPNVINGFSDLMVEVFGENGRAARSAVGMGSLPFRIAVEVEAILEIQD